MGRAQTSFLVVGFGPRGRRWHQEISSHAGVSVAAVVDPNTEARNLAKEAGVSVYATIDAALGAGYGAALVATPPDWHATDAHDCLKAGLPVLVEKPLALSSEDATGLVREAEERGLPLLVGQNFRYLPRERATIRLLREARIGDPEVDVIVSARPEASIPRHLTDLTHGTLWDFVSHHVDVLTIRYGRAPRTIACGFDEMGSTIAPLRRTYRLRLTFDPGPIVYYQHSEAAPHYRYHESIEGPEGAIEVDDQRVYVRLTGGRRRRISKNPQGGEERVILDEFIRSIDGAPSGLEARGNLSTITTIEAALRSLSSGEEVRVESQPD